MRRTRAQSVIGSCVLVVLLSTHVGCGSSGLRALEGMSSEHFVLEIHDDFNSDYLESLLNLLEVAYNESEAIFGLATGQETMVELHRSEIGPWGRAGWKPNTIELHFKDLDDLSIRTSLHEYGHLVFPSSNFDTPLNEGLANLFFLVIGPEITRRCGLEIWPGGTNVSEIAENWLEREMNTWTPGTINAATCLLLELYSDSNGLVFGQAFIGCREEFSRKTEFALMCDFVEHMETLTGKDYSSLMIKYGFDLANPLGHCVHGLELTSYISNVTVYWRGLLWRKRLQITDVSIQNLTSLSIYRYYPEPDTIQDEEGQVRFKYTEYGKLAQYPGKLDIYLRRSLDPGQNITMTISRYLLTSDIRPGTFEWSWDPWLFANCSELTIALSFPRSQVITEAHPQPTTQTSHRVMWTRKDVVAYSWTEDIVRVKWEGPPEHTFTIVATVAFIIAGSVVLVVATKAKKQSQISL